MTLAPLLTAPLAVQVHVAAAMIAVATVIPLAVYRKGTTAHRWFGRIVMGGLVIVALTSFGIRELNPGSFSWIHILSIIVLFNVVTAIRALWRRNIKAHMWIMGSTVFWGLGVAGAFTFMPYRLMWQVFNG